jgi:hypothetical protein
MKTLLFVGLFISLQALAWGPTGHRAVGEIAQKYLTPAASAKVSAILKGNSLARVANWPDEIRSEPKTYSYTYNWHYSTWADEAQDADENPANGLLMTSIREQLKVLKDETATDDKKVFAMKFLVHLVGDLHQPLHVGSGSDQGANACKVFFQGKQTNLHSVWDEGMINFTNLSFTEWANFLMQGHTQADVSAMMTGDVLDWARESKELRGKIYPDNIVPTPAPMSSRTYCRTDSQVLESEMPKLSYEYSYKFVPLVEQRLFQAGVRLAMLLNQNL